MATLFSKLHPLNIAQLKAVVKAEGQAWIHGDGNIYKTEKESNQRAKFSNPKQEDCKYRVHFTNVSAIPNDLDTLRDMLTKSRIKTDDEKDIPEKKITTYAVDEDDVDDLEDDFEPHTATKAGAPQFGPSKDLTGRKAFLEDKEQQLRDLHEDVQQKAKAVHDDAFKVAADKSELEKRALELNAQADQLTRMKSELDAREKALAKKEPKTA